MASYPIELALTGFVDTKRRRDRFLPFVFVSWQLLMLLPVSTAQPILDQSMEPPDCPRALGESMSI